MVLASGVYQELEGIVGVNNISDDPALLDSYRYSLSQTAIHIGPYFNTFTPRGLAVLLPGNTEEVQAIVKACNKHKLKVKASTTFWSAMGYPSDENTIQLDMRRMDRIIEIDRKNMYAVIEPGVIGATLQAEVMQVGLNINIHGAGCSCSLLASATSYQGPGPGSLYMGNNYENLLGVEWVMPDGEIIRVGSPGSGMGWFCGEGPGPSVRGILRGGSGASGALGVFTKCALKLHNWPGPSQLPVEGTVPAYQVAPPDNFRMYTLAFPSWPAWADCCYKIWDAGIGYIAHRQYNMLGRNLKSAMLSILTDPAKTLSDLEEMVNDPDIKNAAEKMQRDFQIVLAGMTQRDIEWQDAVLNEILKETGGWKVEFVNDEAVRKWMFLYLIRLGHKNLNLVYAGGYDGNFGMAGPPDFGTKYVEEAAAFQAAWEKKGSIVDAGGDSMMGAIGGIGGGGGVNWENFTSFDPHDKSSTEGTYELFEASYKYTLEINLTPGMERRFAACRGADGKTPPETFRREMFLNSAQPAVYRYQKKIKEAIDPNNLGDGYYLTLDE